MWKIIEIGNSGLTIADGNYSSKYPRSEEFVKEGVPFIRANNFSNKKIDDNDLLFITPEKHSTITKGHLLPNDILITTRGNIGKVAIVPERHLNSNINAQIVLLRCNENWYPNFLLYVFTSEFVKRQIPKLTTGTALKQLPVKKLKKIKIPLPPLKTQKKIAQILDEADKLRQLNKALIQKYEALTQSLFLDMFGDPVLNPMGWEKVKFGEFISVLTDYHSNGSYKTLSKNVTLLDEPNFALMVRTTDLEKNNFIDNVKYIDEHAYDHLEKSKIFGGEIIMNKIGSAGKIYLMPKLNRPVSLGMNAFLLRFKETINITYIYFFLTSNYGTYQIQKRVKGAVTKTIRKDAVRELPIFYPPLNLQNKFAARTQLIEAQKQQAQEALEKADNLFNSLLQKAFKGTLI